MPSLQDRDGHSVEKPGKPRAPGISRHLAGRELHRFYDLDVVALRAVGSSSGVGRATSAHDRAQRPVRREADPRIEAQMIFDEFAELVRPGVLRDGGDPCDGKIGAFRLWPHRGGILDRHVFDAGRELNPQLPFGRQGAKVLLHRLADRVGVASKIEGAFRKRDEVGRHRRDRHFAEVVAVKNRSLRVEGIPEKMGGRLTAKVVSVADFCPTFSRAASAVRVRTETTCLIGSERPVVAASGFSWVRNDLAVPIWNAGEFPRT